MGAREFIAVPGALTYRGNHDSPAFSRILAETLRGEVKTLAFVVPSRVTWPLPLYELALQTATRLEDEGVEARIVLLTPEETPLIVFGREGSEAVAGLLADKAIELLCGVHVEKFHKGLVHLVPGVPVPAERVIALPGLRGIPLSGVPADNSRFVHVDALGQIKGLEDVYAAGDGTSFPVRSREGWPPRWRTPQPLRSRRRPAPGSSLHRSTPFSAVSS